MILRALIFISIISAHLPVAAQELTRRSFLGIQMEVITNDVRNIMGLSEQYGVLIGKVIPRSTAEAAGFQRGDILLRLNDQPVKDPQDAVAIVGMQRSGAKFSYEIIRDKKKITGNSVFQPYPKEAYPDIDMQYTQVKTPSGLQRVIIGKSKKQGRLPVVVFIGGIGCYSLDFPLDSTRSEVQLLNRLARGGYMTVRLEKPGMGDGAGVSTPCNQVGFMEETEGYIQAIAELKKRPDVDPDQVFIFGHSMGGAMAPLIAAKTGVKGVVAYGTLGSNFIEYLAKTRRTIGEAYGWAPDETDAFVKDFCECAGFYFVEKLTTAEAAKKNASCTEYLSVFDLRSRKYNDELYSLNIPNAWKSFSGKALLAWGSSDFISAKEDHQIVWQAVEFYHPGNAEFLVVPGADHGMNTAGSFKEARLNPGPFNPQTAALVLQWLDKHRS